MTTISNKAIFVYISTLLVVVLFSMGSVFFVPAEETGLRAALLGFSLLIFTIGSIVYYDKG